MKNLRDHTRRTSLRLLAAAGLIICAPLFPASTGLACAQAPAPSWSYTGGLNSATLRANGKIAFTSDRDGNREIYVMNADGTNQVRLTNNSLVDDHPAWSPDGTKIAFVGEKPSGGFAIFIMNADGANKVEVTPLIFNATAQPIWDFWGMSWSPDGNRIVFQEKVETSSAPVSPNDLYIVDIDGRNRRLLLRHSLDERQPAWSPDGSKILFSRQVSPFYSNLFTIRPDGTDLQPLANDPTELDIAATWSPTGDKVAFVRYDYAGNWGVKIANADGSNRSWLDDESDDERDKLDWSPDGSKIVFHALGSPERGTQIYVENIDGSGLTRLTSLPGNNFKPSWQPLFSTACPNPIDCAEFFVRQHYLDFLGREPEPQGFIDWQRILNECNVGSTGCDRIEVSSDFFRSPEFLDRGYFVYKFYSAVGRVPRFEEFMPDMKRVTGFQTDQQLEANKVSFMNDFVTRADFTNRYGAITDPPAYVSAIEQTLGVTLSNRAALISGLQSGTETRATVLRKASEDSQVGVKFYTEAFVIMQYFGYLRRTADASYLQWIQTMNQDPSNYRIMVNGFLNSTEYRRRFGP